MASDKHHETFVANEDLRTHRYTIMVNSGSKLVARVGTAGVFGVGILETEPNSGQNASVVVRGTVKMFAGGTIVGGNEITTTASGTATAAASGDYIIGAALTGVASGGLFDGVVLHAGYKS